MRNEKEITATKQRWLSCDSHTLTPMGRPGNFNGREMVASCIERPIKSTTFKFSLISDLHKCLLMPQNSLYDCMTCNMILISFWLFPSFTRTHIGILLTKVGGTAVSVCVCALLPRSCYICKQTSCKLRTCELFFFLIHAHTTPTRTNMYTKIFGNFSACFISAFLFLCTPLFRNIT